MSSYWKHFGHVAKVRNAKVRNAKLALWNGLLIL